MTQTVTFEDKIRRIEEILEILDTGELPLEELLKYYGEGIALTAECREFIKDAELKVIEISKAQDKPANQ